jgi:pilus assembly protein CpaE
MDQSSISMLLPASGVDFFALDDGTAAAAMRLTHDWRFARVAVNAERAGIEAAIAKYAQSASPDIIIVETNDISDAFIQQLGALAAVCAAGTDAVVIGPMNDVHLYRNLVGMGVRDYLVRPVSDDEIIEVIARSIIEKRGLSGSRLITTIGSKGGVGATSVAQSIAWNIAEHLLQKTVLMDLAGSGGSIGIAFGIEPSTPMSEAVRIGSGGSEDDMKRIIQPVTEHLSLLFCGGDPILADPPEPDAIESLVTRLMQKHPVVVIDLSAAAPQVQKRLLARSSHTVIVSSPLLPSLRNTRSLISEIRHLRGGLKEVDVVINMYGIAGQEEVPFADIKKALDIEPAARLPYVPKIFSAGEVSGKPVGKNKAAQDVMKALLDLCIRATGGVKPVTDPGKPVKEGFLHSLLKRK